MLKMNYRPKCEAGHHKNPGGKQVEHSLTYSNEIKAKINKCDIVKFKSLCKTKEAINKIKTTYKMGENICK